MATRLVDSRWSGELLSCLQADASELRIISPFIKLGALNHLLATRPKRVWAITRFNLDDCAMGVSDLAALRFLLECGAAVRGIKNLHAKMYLFGSKRAIVTSANLTQAALNHNHEFGIVSDDQGIIVACRRYFDDLWARSGADLVAAKIDDWDERITRYQANGGSKRGRSRLGDFGADLGLASTPPGTFSIAMADAPQSFVKFLGQSGNRAPLSFPISREIDRAGCHWAVAYPAGKRPRSVKDGAVIFISRLTRDPGDIRVFGRAIAMQHVPGRDDATPADIKRRSWKADWPHYIRVHHAEFVAGTMQNGVSLGELMEELGANAFASTERNAIRGDGNIDPRRAYQRQPGVALSEKGAAWLGERLQSAFEHHGQIPQNDLDKLDWPSLPPV
ncbi:MAG: phospholipase D family protein [Pseudomonadota bacterium]